MRPLRIALAFALAVACAATVRAQLAVFDPSNYAKAVEELAQLQQQYAQLVRSYELLAMQATRAPGDLGARYRSNPVPWLNLTAPDTYGVTGGWVHAANTGHEVPDGYQAVTEALRTDRIGGEGLSDIAVARMRRQYGGVELNDGVTLHSLEMIGHLRGHAYDTEIALRRLEDDSYSGDDSLNTQVAVLNKINASSVTGARLVKDTNQILIAQLDQQLIESARRRDAEVQALNAQFEWQRRQGEILQGPIAETTATLTRFRFP
jgi:hypothetical protein